VKRGNKLPDPVETGDENTVDAIMPVKARPKTKDKE
jgi:hypothetical protein